jgi:hypothetical protein
MAFRVGQKVVCVDDTNYHPDSGNGEMGGELPVKGNIYIVSATGLTNPVDPNNLPCIHVEGLDRDDEYPLWAHRFRPLTDISIFEEMLKKKPHQLLDDLLEMKD